MSVKGDISKGRSEADLRLYTEASSNPQAAYARTKLRIWGVSLIVASPVGLLFGGVGIVVMIVLGFILLVLAGRSGRIEKHQLAEIQEVNKKQLKQQQEEKAVDLEYKKLMIEKMKREARNSKK